MLAISTRGRYSVRILVLMASQPKGHIFAKYEIAEAEGVSCAYIQQLMTTLKAAGYVGSHRGREGGFILARSAETITVADVLGVTEGQVALSPCLGGERCERQPRCPVRPMWVGATKVLEDYFKGVTIAELAGKASSSYIQVAEGA